MCRRIEKEGQRLGIFVKLKINLKNKFLFLKRAKFWMTMERKLAPKNQINALFSNIYWPLGIWGYQLSKGQFLYCRRDGNTIQMHLPRIQVWRGPWMCDQIDLDLNPYFKERFLLSRDVCWWGDQEVERKLRRAYRLLKTPLERLGYSWPERPLYRVHWEGNVLYWKLTSNRRTWRYLAVAVTLPH